MISCYSDVHRRKEYSHIIRMRAFRTSLLLKFQLCFHLIGNSFELSFDEVKSAGSGVDFSASDLLTLKQRDLELSLIYLGKDQLKPEQASAIWKALIKAYGDVNAIPDTCLQQLGWVASGIPPEDFSNITLTEIDTIAAFGQFHNLSEEQLIALAEQVHNSWAAKEPEDYTCYDLIALQHILCGFNRSIIERIHPSAYSEASNTLGGLKNCSLDVLQGLATLATDISAFGSPEQWTATQVNAIGCVLGGLDASAFSIIPAKSLEYLQPEAAHCIPSDLIKAMSAAQRDVLSSSVFSSLNSEQKAALGSQIQKVPCNNSSELACNGSQSSTWVLEVMIIITTMELCVEVSRSYILTL